MKKVYRAHPLMIWKFVKPYLFILLLPMLRALLQYLHIGEFYGFVRWEIIFLSLIFAFALLRCCFFKVSCDEKYVTIRSGVFFVKVAEIEIEKLSSVQTARNPFDQIFGALTFRINTEAGERTKSDYEFKLKFSDAKELAKILYGNTTVSKQRVSALKVAIMAAATSSAFTGMIIGVPIIKRAGDLLGIALSDMLWSEINNISSKIETHFPPVVNALSLTLLLAYAVSFIYSFLKFVNFRVILGEKRLEVRSGIITRMRTAFTRRSVIDVKIEQTALMVLLKRFSMKVSVGGFGDAKSESQVMVPSGKYNEIKKDFSFYFPFLTVDHNFILPQRGFLAKTRFLYWPNIYLFLVLGISIPLGVIFDELTRFIYFLTFVSLCVVFYYAYICYWQYVNSKFSIGKNFYAKSKRMLRTCEMFCPKDRIGQIKITRIFTDFFYGTCKIRVTTCSENADSIKLSHFDYKSVLNEIYKAFDIAE